MAQTHQFCTFYLDKLMFGVELEKVQEVIRYLEITEIPLASRVVSGLINLRGQIVMGVDLRRRLNLADRPEETPPMNVVIRSGDGAVSLLVDYIGDVVEVTEESFERPPETLQGKVREVILGVHKLDKQLMHVLNTEKACEVAVTVASGATPQAIRAF
jgi:purine-binding chemotaxis protein CheW